MYNKLSKFLFLLLFLLFPLTVMNCWGEKEVSGEYVSIINKGTYYAVTFDFSKNPSHRQVGEEYGEMILRVLPTFEAKLDFFLAECTMAVPQADMFARVNIIKDKIPQDYRDEIEGMASKFSGRCDRIGDGRVSTNELYIINLLGDVVRPSACSGLSVYGDRSATGSTLVGRALDYYSGTLAKMTGAHAVLNIKNGEKSICSIATLGAIAVGSGFNKNGVFGALLDSPTKTPYSAKGKYSYMMDLRYALENESTMEGVINYLGNPHREYPFNHNFLFSDPETSVVLENNFTGTGSNIRRAVRTEDSVLNAGVTPWNFDNSICVVNSFILQGNHDNHIGDTHNEMRWDNYVRLFGELDYVVSMDDIKKVMSYDDPNDTDGLHGDIFRNTAPLGGSTTVQLMMFEPAAKKLEVYFEPTSGPLLAPVFETIDVEI